VPFVSRPDGVRIAWEERGKGPPIVLANQFFGDADTFEALIDDLTRDHRFISYDLRGTGNSTRQGPYDFETDAADLEVVVEACGEAGGEADGKAGGERAILVAFADGCNRAVRVAARRPDLVTAVVTPAGNPVGLAAVQGTDALAASSSVLAALVGMMGTDYRGALRTMFATANPDWDDERVRLRVATIVEKVPQEAALPRMKAWIADDVIEGARALGDRLWMLESGTNAWFPIEVARRTRAILPEAHILEVEGGAISRPDIASSFIRGLTSGVTSQAAAGSERREQAL
jgi:pimeloyl-ACP methyl ester carboxylesterase